MKKYPGLFILLTLSLAACGEIGRVSSAPDPFGITPSRTPRIVTATPNIVIPTTSLTLPPPPSLTPILDLTPSASPTFTETLPAPPNETTPATLAIPLPTITLLGCNTGFDVTHGMGEVTNAYVVIANYTSPSLTNVCATLSAADEGREHPDKTACVAALSAGFQVTFKLTIDTTYSVNTIVDVTVVSDQGISNHAGGLACKDIGSFIPADNTLGVVIPIP